MKTIGFAGVLKLLNQSRFLLGYWSPSPEDWKEHGYQLTFGLKFPITVKGKRIGERTEWHCVTFGVLPEALPATYLHADYGTLEALRILFREEIKASKKKSGAFPWLRAKAADWGTNAEGTRPARFVVDGRTPGETLTNRVYVATFHHADAYLYMGDFTFRSAGEFSAPHWDSGVEKDDGESASYCYQFQPEGEEKKTFEGEDRADA